MLDGQDVRGRSVSLVIHTFDRGGSGRVAAYLARGFADHGMVVDLTVFARGGDVEALATELAGQDIPIRYFGRSSGIRPLDLMLGMGKLVRQLRADRPDFVVSCANNVALVCAVAHRRSGVPGKLFVKTTNPIATSRHKGLVRRIRLWTYGLAFRWVSAVWTLSSQESDEMRDAFPGFASLFRDVANPYVTTAMLAEPTAPPAATGKTVIAVARLTAQKRLERLIAAFAEVRHPNTRLLILGEGEERAALTAQIATLGLQDRVSMPGYVNDVAGALHAADLFVLPSDYEGLPAVVLESMAANCPVLGTDCFPAAQHLLGQSEGCAIIERTDPASLAAQIDAHLLLPRPSSLRAIAARYSIPQGVESHLDALRSAA
ncbi:glycosyltransferase [Sphingomonas nostoxanthinifaciens]|uniref:glycosyltransferase n=1 Tax=Sphingomonas nostoxanthinifaciens TaxID=2872652 RepID=UPI001CC1F48A|nr:glycosyltransferase [Sphingomonas nostoxanthinifaciens]UAK22845.1 glycosyltransferase [Sphingomonas nostoxanthinifaciens]